MGRDDGLFGELVTVVVLMVDDGLVVQSVRWNGGSGRGKQGLRAVLVMMTVGRVTSAFA